MRGDCADVLCCVSSSISVSSRTAQYGMLNVCRRKPPHLVPLGATEVGVGSPTSTDGFACFTVVAPGLRNLPCNPDIILPGDLLQCRLP